MSNELKVNVWLLVIQADKIKAHYMSLVSEFQSKGVQTFFCRWDVCRYVHTYHICESHVEEEACRDCCNPLFGCGVGGDWESDVEADKGGQRAAHVQQQSFLHRHAAVQQHSKITCAQQQTHLDGKTTAAAPVLFLVLLLTCERDSSDSRTVDVHSRLRI